MPSDAKIFAADILKLGDFSQGEFSRCNKLGLLSVERALRLVKLKRVGGFQTRAKILKRYLKLQVLSSSRIIFPSLFRRRIAEAKSGVNASEPPPKNTV